MKKVGLQIAPRIGHLSNAAVFTGCQTLLPMRLYSQRAGLIRRSTLSTRYTESFDDAESVYLAKRNANHVLPPSHSPPVMNLATWIGKLLCNLGAPDVRGTTLDSSVDIFPSEWVHDRYDEHGMQS